MSEGSGFDKHMDRFERRPVRTGLTWLFGALIAAVVIAGILWAVGVFTSPIKGQGDAYKQKNSAQNWTSAQAGFQRDYNTFQNFKQQIIDAKQKLAAFDQQHPNLDNGTAYNPLAEQRSNLDRTVTGLTQQCQNTATSYNTAAGSYLSEQFRDAVLPAHLDPVECSNAAPLATAPVQTPSR